MVPISALQGNNTGTLVDLIFRELPEGPAYYPADQVTDSPEQFIVAELIRKKVLFLTREEIPHSVAVVVEEYYLAGPGDRVHPGDDLCGTPLPKGDIDRKAGGHAEGSGPTGPGGDRTFARGSKVYLDLWVKVKKDWRNEEAYLRRFGYGDVE